MNLSSNKSTSLVILLLASSILLTSCRAAPAPQSEFLDSQTSLHQDKSLPFNAVWFKEGINLRSFSYVHIKDVDTQHLIESSWWDKLSFAESFDKFNSKNEIPYLAKFFKEKLRAQFLEDKKKFFSVKEELETNDENTLIIELALIEVVPTKIWLNTIGYATLGPFSFGSTAMEGRIRLASTGEVIGKFKDREFGQIALLSIADLQWYSHSKHTLEYWSEEIFEICQRKPDEAISRMPTFTLRPW